MKYANPRCLGAMHPFTDTFPQNSALKSCGKTVLCLSQGIEHVKMLKRLILYYNRIPSLEELKVLYQLPALRELDLRLNPLTITHPNYRLHLVNDMPNLRKLGKNRVTQVCWSQVSFCVTECPPLFFRWLFNQRHGAQGCRHTVLWSFTSAKELICESGCWPKVQLLSDA